VRHVLGRESNQYLESTKRDSEMKQTAVQWFALKVMHLKMNPKQAFEFIEWFDQAKQMEKEQIKDAHLNGQSEWDIKSLEDINKKLAEEYYKETYE
jgi:hypothetical protein